MLVTFYSSLSKNEYKVCIHDTDTINDVLEYFDLIHVSPKRFTNIYINNRGVVNDLDFINKVKKGNKVELYFTPFKK